MSRAASKLAGPASDRELIAAISRGELEALGALFERHEPLVRRYLGRLGVAAGDADDLVQATFLEAMRAAERFDARHAARSWLLGITSMMVRRHRRSLGRAAHRVAVLAGIVRAAPTSERDAAAILEGDAVLRAVARALARLPAKKREVFVLVSLEGLSGEEAAAALGVPVKTVWTRLHHARRALRAALPEAMP